MFVTFFSELKSAGIPVSLREYLTLMEALEADLAERRVEDFYHLARVCLVRTRSTSTSSIGSSATSSRGST
jgi:uncharacterized protein with von Willebrand factor type A (vWA) domain